MNQIMPIGKGVLVAIEHAARAEMVEAFRAKWREELPDVPVFVVAPAQIVERGEITLFEFTGEVSPTMVAEFQRWWKEVQS